MYNPAVRPVYSAFESFIGLGMTSLPPSTSVTGDMCLYSKFKQVEIGINRWGTNFERKIRVKLMRSA
jgi:hypothetical protein